MRKLFIGLAMSLASCTALASPELSFCSGAAGGFYDDIVQVIAKDISSKAKIKVEVVNTGGSVENAELLKDGTCQLAIMQADAVTSKPLPPDIRVTDAHQEAVFWIHGKTGLEDFTDLSAKANAKRGVAIVGGGGAEVTLRNFGMVDEDYKNVLIVPFDSWDEAAEAARNGYMQRGGRVEIAGMIYVGRMGKISTDIIDGYKEGLTIGEIDESSFLKAKDSNGNPLYTKCLLDDKAASGLKTDTWTKPSTLCMRAQVLYNNDLFDGMDKKEAMALKKVINKSINTNLNAFR